MQARWIKSGWQQALVALPGATLLAFVCASVARVSSLAYYARTPGNDGQTGLAIVVTEIEAGVVAWVVGFALLLALQRRLLRRGAR